MNMIHGEDNAGIRRIILILERHSEDYKKKEKSEEIKHSKY